MASAKKVLGGLRALAQAEAHLRATFQALSQLLSAGAAPEKLLVWYADLANRHNQELDDLQRSLKAVGQTQGFQPVPYYVPRAPGPLVGPDGVESRYCGPREGQGLETPPLGFGPAVIPLLKGALWLGGIWLAGNALQKSLQAFQGTDADIARWEAERTRAQALREVTTQFTNLVVQCAGGSEDSEHIRKCAESMLKHLPADLSKPTAPREKGLGVLGWVGIITLVGAGTAAAIYFATKERGGDGEMMDGAEGDVLSPGEWGRDEDISPVKGYLIQGSV